MRQHSVSIVIISLAILLPVPAARAPLVVLLPDSIDDWEVLSKARAAPDAIALCKDVKAMRYRMLQWQLRDYHAQFGTPSIPGSRDYARMSTEPRTLLRSGIHYGDEKLNKDHTDYHVLGDMGYIQVDYSIDGTSPAFVHFLLKIDKDFVKLERIENIEKRLAWEKPRFAEMCKLIERRWRAVVVWEVDSEQQNKQYEGIDSPNFASKLKAMIRWGEKNGYKLENPPPVGEATPHFRWYDGKSLMAEASHFMVGSKGAECIPNNFILYREGGWTLRDESGGPGLSMVRFWRPKGVSHGVPVNSLIRLERGTYSEGVWRPLALNWYNVEGKAIRSEWDTNSDGLPDTYRDGDYYDHDKPGFPLAVDRSWAIHPELIPEECRIPDQEKRRIPIRRMMP